MASQFENNLSNFLEVARKYGRKTAIGALHLAGKALVKDIQLLINVPGYGEPSPPGMPPHRQTGTLHDSIRYEVDAKRLRVRVIADTPYAWYLEYGWTTPSGTHVGPRPFMRRGIAAFLTRGKLADCVRISYGIPRHLTTVV